MIYLRLCCAMSDLNCAHKFQFLIMHVCSEYFPLTAVHMFFLDDFTTDLMSILCLWQFEMIQRLFVLRN